MTKFGIETETKQDELGTSNSPKIKKVTKKGKSLNGVHIVE